MLFRSPPTGARRGSSPQALADGERCSTAPQLQRIGAGEGDAQDAEQSERLTAYAEDRQIGIIEASAIAAGAHLISRAIPDKLSRFGGLIR